MVRAGLRLLLDAEEDIETVGEAGDAREAIFEARSTKPDVVLMDVVLGGQSGIEVTPELLHEQPDVKVLILSMQDDPHYVREAFAAGACGYVLKEAADAELVLCRAGSRPRRELCPPGTRGPHGRRRRRRRAGRR